jgi:hypothetical protein
MSRRGHTLTAKGLRSGAAGRATRNGEEAPMEKRALGEIRVHQRQDGLRTYSLRFRVNGKRRSITLGTDADGWNDRRAERKLEDVLAEIRVGMWRPPAPSEANDEREMTFHEFASRWWAARRGELRHKTQLDYEWQLQKHLLPFFADYPVAKIDLALVERYREDKLIERERVRAAAEAGYPIRDKRGQRRMPMSNGSINKTLVTLAQILESAVERGLVDSNPASGRRRRLKTSKADPPALGSRRPQGAAFRRRGDGPNLPALSDRPAADDRRDGQIGTPSDRDVHASLARR